MSAIILAGPDEHALMQAAYPAFAVAGLSVTAVTSTPQKLSEIASAFAGGDTVIVVEADLYPTPQEATEALASLSPSRVAAIVPRRWAEHQEAFAALPNFLAGYTAPVGWAQVAVSVKGHIDAPHTDPVPSLEGRQPSLPAAAPTRTEEPVETSPPDDPGPRLDLSRARRGPIVRLGLYGKRGGVGTSTAALAAARALAEKHSRVALFDTTERGDLHVMAGTLPSERPVVQGGITLFLGAPAEDTTRDFDAVVVDGGRKRGQFNADWIAVESPLSEDRIRRLAGLEPEQVMADDDGEGLPPARDKSRRAGLSGLSKLISIEVIE